MAYTMELYERTYFDLSDLEVCTYSRCPESVWFVPTQTVHVY